MARTSTADDFRLSSPLERYTHNLTKLARQGAFSPLEGHDPAVNRIFQILERKSKNNPALLDNNESRRIAIAMEAVRRLAIGDFLASRPYALEVLSTRRIIALDLEALFSNLEADASLNKKFFQQWFLQRWPGKVPELLKEWQALEEQGHLTSELERLTATTIAFFRLRAMCQTIYETDGPFILLVDQLQCIVGNEGGKYSVDATPILMVPLALGQVQLIGACTLEQYRLYIECDAAFQRRFQEIVIPETYQLES